MRNRLVALLAAAASLGAAQAAFAADLPVKAPPPAAVVAANWSGCYVGGQVGYGWVRDKLVETIVATGALSPLTPSDTAHPSGLKAGGLVGCNWQWSGAFVVGVEGDGEWADIGGSTVVYPLTLGDTYQTRIRWQASARGRVGYALDRTLVYVTGGAAFANIRHEYTLAAAGLSERFTTNRVGWTVGAGVEHAFQPNWTARVEYRYADFGHVTNIPTIFGSAFRERHTITEHVVRGALAYKFTGF
jgi:outer membrane immunogenic protein